MARMLLTGGAGFIGSHLSERLLKDGHNVTVIDNLLSGQIDNIAHLFSNKRFRFVEDDIRNQSAIQTLVSWSDIVFHLAAAVGVFSIVKNPIETISINVDGTRIILDACQKFDKKILIASTSEVYGKNGKFPFKEDDDSIMGATTKTRWSYAASKQLDEFLALAYFQQYKVPVVIFRLFNTVGPRQRGHYGMVVPRFVQWALKGSPIEVYGEGNQSRCFANVLDVIEAIYSLSKNDKAIGDVFNIGTQEEVTIDELASRVVERAKSNSKVIHIPYDVAYTAGFEDMKKRVPDTTKIRNLIGWYPRIRLDETIDQIIAYESVRLGIPV